MEAKSVDPADIDAVVRSRLRELRAERGLTLEDVARRAQIDVSTLSRLESGKRRLALDHLPRLAAGASPRATVLELQPSSISEDERSAREAFYRRGHRILYASALSDIRRVWMGVWYYRGDNGLSRAR